MAISTRTLYIVGGLVVGALVLDRLVHPTISNPYQSPALGGAQAGGPTVTVANGYLSWSVVPGAAYYEVQPSMASGSPVGSPIQVSVTDIQVASLPAGTQYVIVRGCSTMACGPWSAVQSVSTTLPTPGAVTNINATATTNSVTITWTVPAGAAYTELMHTDASGNAAPASDAVTVNGATGNDWQIDAPGNSVTVTGLAAGSPFHFIMRACN